MYITRIAKIVMVACLALFCLLVVFTSLHDYQTNFLFVKKVMSMETTFPGNRLMYRAINAPELWHATYAIIMAGEALAGLLFLAGAVRLFQVRRAPGAVFDRAKSLTVAGALVAYIVWFLIFMVFAGEWFVMWQSQTWNGQEAAFRFYLTVMAVLIFVVLPDGDLERSAPTGAAAKAPPKQKRQPAKKTSGKKGPARTAPVAKRAPAKKKAPAKKHDLDATAAESALQTTASMRAAKARLAETQAKIEKARNEEEG